MLLGRPAVLQVLELYDDVVLLLDELFGGRACAVRAVPHVGAGGVRAVHSAQRAGAEAG